MFCIFKVGILIGIFAPLGDATPLENHLLLSSEPHYDVGNPWIGSHTLKFTPNPFLLMNALDPDILSRAKQLTGDDTESNPIDVVSTGESPIYLESTTQPPEDPYNNYVTQPKMGKRGRKHRRRVKGRRRLSPNKPSRNLATRYKTKRDNVEEGKRRFLARKPRRKLYTFPTPLAEVQKNTEVADPMVSDFGRVDFLPIDRVSKNPPIYKWRGLKSKTNPGQSLLPTVTPTPVITTSEAKSFPSKEEDVAVRITPPPPIKPEVVVGSKKNLIPVDIILNHADKLDPSFFRNIILKTMMDKLVEVEVAKNGPQLASSSEKTPDNKKLS